MVAYPCPQHPHRINGDTGRWALFRHAPARLAEALVWTVGSGIAFMLLELYGSMHWLFDVRGLLTVVKLALVILVPMFWSQRIRILLSIIVIGSVAS